MKKIIVDANVFLRYLFNDIPEQKRVFEKLLQRAKKLEVALFVPQIIIFEIQFILDKYYHIEKKEVVDKLKSLVSSGYIQVENREAFLSALSLYANENVSFVDCFLIVKAKSEKAELFTFDQKAQKIYKR